MVITRTRTFADGSEIIAKIKNNNNSNLPKRKIKRSQYRNTMYKRYIRTMNKLLGSESTHFLTLTVDENNELRYDPKRFLQLAKKFLNDSNVTYTIVLEKYSNDDGYHIHGLLDKKIDLLKWADLTKSNINDCYCQKIKDNRLAAAKYILKNIHQLPKNLRFCATNQSAKKSHFKIEKDNKIVFDNVTFKNDDNNQNYHKHFFKNEIFKLNQVSQNNHLASANISIIDYEKSTLMFDNILLNKLDNTKQLSSYKTLKYILNAVIDLLKNSQLFLKIINAKYRKTRKCHFSTIRLCVTKIQVKDVTLFKSDFLKRKPPNKKLKTLTL